jgi:hypothetical protein
MTENPDRDTSFRALVPPKEHGSWSLAFEPVALALLAAPSWAGAALAGATVAGFFTRRPLKLAVTLPAGDARRAAAMRWAALFGVVAAGFLALAGALGSWTALGPLLVAAPFGALFLWFDLRNEMREAEAELAGSTAFALAPAAFATLAGWPAAPAFALAAIAVARNVPTVLTVRSFLRLQKRQKTWPVAAVVAAGFSTGALAVLARQGLVPLAAALVSALLLARTLALVLPIRPDWPARRVGILEAVLGVVQLLAVGLAYRFA